MMNLPDKNSKVSTALEHVVDPAAVKTMVTKGAKILTFFVLKRAQPHLTYQTSWIILKREDV